MKDRRENSVRKPTQTERENSSEFRVSSSVESLFPATVPGPNPGSTMQLAAQMQKSLWRTVRAERRTSGTKVKKRNVPVGKEGSVSMYI